MWRLAKSLAKLREQINAEFPHRDKTSDGSVGDLAHKGRKSDHNPNLAGVVTAIDIDEDLNGDRTLEQIVTAIRRSKDKRVKYIIYEGRITVQGSDLQSWKKYSGINKHDHHAHISVAASPSLYDDNSDWSINGTADTLATKPSVSLPTLRRGSKGLEVKALQLKLNTHGFKLDADGDFGPSTERAVRAFQNANELTGDGIVGEKTWLKL